MLMRVVAILSILDEIFPRWAGFSLLWVLLAILSLLGIVDNHLYRCVAQPGSALRSGRRGRRFESSYTDQMLLQYLPLCS